MAGFAQTVHPHPLRMQSNVATEGRHAVCCCQGVVLSHTPVLKQSDRAPAGPARQGKARQGKARQGKARQDKARKGKA